MATERMEDLEVSRTAFWASVEISIRQEWPTPAPVRIAANGPP